MRFCPFNPSQCWKAEKRQGNKDYTLKKRKWGF